MAEARTYAWILYAASLAAKGLKSFADINKFRDELGAKIYGIEPGNDGPVGVVANALPQALVLTAIVIGFGLFAFALILMFRAYTTLGTLDSDEMRVAEPVAKQETSA